MLEQLTNWLFNLVKGFFLALWNFVTDAFIGLVDMCVGAMVSLAALIPVPSFMSGGLQSLFGQLDPAIVYLVTASGIPAGLAIIGTAYVFRIGRKVVTLFQW
ncbi:DUF2523 family protein [Pelomonas cellulosilytica]|uniref:Minor coat protein n=1 Tax=Pelomonas cellulosilytica TaxID=2906762 RepID=A0ABS8XT07_9BURK|nr:DUF2523 family protein [Pelomonas sp. P8]MCE4555008.1 hypothetical protein [Pelomonas sp. P8]